MDGWKVSESNINFTKQICGEAKNVDLTVVDNQKQNKIEHRFTSQSNFLIMP